MDLVGAVSGDPRALRSLTRPVKQAMDGYLPQWLRDAVASQPAQEPEQWQPPPAQQPSQSWLFSDIPQKNVRSSPTDFPEFAEFQERVRQQFDERLLTIDTPDGPVPVSARELASIAAAESELAMGAGKEEALAAAREVSDRVLKYFDGTEMGPNDGLSDYSGRVRSIATNILNQLQSTGIGGENAAFAGMTDEEAADRGKIGNEGRYTTSQGFEENLKRSRAYDLFTALSDIPGHQPVFADPVSGALSQVSGLYGAITAADGLFGGPSAENRELWRLRNVVSARNPAEARVKEALYWDSLGQQAERENIYRDSLYGGFNPRESWTTGQGMQRQAADSANALSYLENWKSQLFSGTPVFGDASGLSTLMQDLDREVPRIPDGASPEEAEQAQRDLRQYADTQESQYTTNYPLYQRSFFGEAKGRPIDWMDAASRAASPLSGLFDKPRQYSLPSVVNQNIAMGPKYWFDVPTIATLGALGATGGFRSPMQAAAAVGADYLADNALVEQPVGLGIYASQEPYRSDPSALFRAQPKEATRAVGRDGLPVDPNAPEYPSAARRVYGQQKKLLDGLRQYHNNYYPPSRGGNVPASVRAWGSAP